MPLTYNAPALTFNQNTRNAVTAWFGEADSNITFANDLAVADDLTCKDLVIQTSISAPADSLLATSVINDGGRQWLTNTTQTISGNKTFSGNAVFSAAATFGSDTIAATSVVNAGSREWLTTGTQTIAGAKTFSNNACELARH